MNVSAFLEFSLKALKNLFKNNTSLLGLLFFLFRLSDAMKNSSIDEYEFSASLANALKRVVFYTSEKDIEEDIQHDINEFNLLTNFYSNMSSILESVRIRN